MVRGTFKGVVQGNTIKLDRELGLRDGQSVRITVETADSDPRAGAGFRQSFGAWTGDDEELAQFMLDVRRDRDAASRLEPSP
jgi:hypothetical protein